jgi:hypothetical protein
MLNELLYEKNNYLTLLFWVLVGAFAGPLVYVVVPVHMLVLNKKGALLWILLGLWLVLTLSDSRQPIFSFAVNLKTAMMLVMGYLFLVMPKEDDPLRFIKPFIPFFAVAFIALIGSPVAFGGFQKTVSYVLLLTVIPPTVNLLLTWEKERFLYHLIMVGVIVSPDYWATPTDWEFTGLCLLPCLLLSFIFTNTCLPATRSFLFMH